MTGSTEPSKRLIGKKNDNARGSATGSAVRAQLCSELVGNGMDLVILLLITVSMRHAIGLTGSLRPGNDRNSNRKRRQTHGMRRGR